MIRKRVGNGIWILADRLSKGLIALFVGAIVARHLGPEDYGILVYVIACTAFVQAIVNLGLDGIVVRSLVEIEHSKISSIVEKDASRLVSTVFAMRTLASVIGWIGTVTIMYFFSEFITFKIGLVVVAVVFFQAADVIDLWYQSNSNNGRSSKYKIAAYFASAIFKVVLVAVDADLFLFGVATFVDFGIVALALLVSIKGSVLSLRPEYFDWQLAKRLVKESWQYCLSGLLVITSTKLDQLLINLYMDKKSVGLYSVIVSIVAGFNILSSVVSATALPLVSKYKVIDQEKYIRTLARIFRANLLFSFALALTISCNSERILKVLFGEQYSAAANSLRIYAFTIIPSFILYSQTLWVSNERKQVVFLYQTILTAVLSLSLNMLFLPRYGIMGATIAACISLPVALLLVSYFAAPTFFYIQLGFAPKKLIR